MTRTFTLVLGIALTLVGVTSCAIRLTADGWAALALLGFLIVIVTNRWDGPFRA